MFAIQLHLGDASIRRRTHEVRKGDSFGARGIGGLGDSASQVHIARRAKQNADEKESLDVNDLAIENLRTQLGLSKSSVTDGTLQAKSLREMSAIPLPEACFTGISEYNRLVPKVGEHIDVLLPLMSGDHTAFLFEARECYAATLAKHRGNKWRSDRAGSAVFEERRLMANPVLGMRRLVRKRGLCSCTAQMNCSESCRSSWKEPGCGINLWPAGNNIGISSRR